ncbi:MAG TPA: FAD/NAD(P)-binding protein, partial [Phenylobacterium sp.]|nr:FAD/NAD(P)-binding protein [Phenylobacterium sp.]
MRLMPHRFASKVRIIGGGLTGILAAFEAHRLGARDIELHERHEQLGGQAWPRQSHGLEIREAPLAFGAPGDPVRDLLEANGLAFEDYENHRGAVSPAAGRDIVHVRDFAGPALRTRDLALGAVQGESLADRLRAYPSDIGHALSNHCQWALGAWLDEVHAGAAEALGVDRVFPIGTDIADLASLKRANPTADALYGIPAPLWGRLQGLTASTPRDGVQAFLMRARQALVRLGVEVCDTQLVAPHAALKGRDPGEIVIWAVDPTPLFKPLGLEAPSQAPRRMATYVFKARLGAGAPVEVRNFTAEGVVSTLRLYESRGHWLIAADCVAEAGDGELRREIHRLMAGFCGSSLQLGDAVSMGIAPRWDCP